MKKDRIREQRNLIALAKITFNKKSIEKHNNKLKEILNERNDKLEVECLN